MQDECEFSNFNSKSASARLARVEELSSRHSYPIEIGKILCSMTGRRIRRPHHSLLGQHFCCNPLTVVHSPNHTARRFQRLDPILNGTAR